MKNIIFFLLIILFIISSVEQDTELTFAQKWAQVRNSSAEAINLLKESGYYDFLINLLKTYDTEIAIKICSTRMEEPLCRDIINFLLGLIQ